MIGAIVLTYITIASSGSHVNFNPKYIFALFTNKWAEGVISGAPAEPIALSAGALFAWIGGIIAYFCVIKPKYKEYKLKRTVKDKFDWITYFLNWIKIVIGGFALYHLGLAFGNVHFIIFLYGSGMILKLYTDINRTFNRKKSIPALKDW